MTLENALIDQSTCYFDPIENDENVDTLVFYLAQIAVLMFVVFDYLALQPWPQGHA